MADIDERLDALNEFNFNDDQRNIESASLSIDINNNIDSNYIERNAYDSKFIDSLYIISKMKDILKNGEYFVNAMYTYRSCSKAIPQAKNSDENSYKEELNKTTFQVLEPEIQKIKDLYNFQKDTIKYFCNQVQIQVSSERRTEVVPENILWHMLKIIDLLALLDALLNMKACLITDFSFYKRIIKPSEDNKLDATALSELGLFLAKQNRITEHFKNEIKEIKGFDEIIIILINMCATYIETERYVLPSDKHSLLRVIPYGLFLMDGREGNLINIFKNKKINIKRFSIIFKKYPIVTLYGDMQIKLENMIKSTPNYTPGSWPLSDTEKMAREYEIIHHLPTIRQQHQEYMGKFKTFLNMVKLDPPDNNDIEFSKNLTNNILEGLSLISNWTSRILQQSAWKYFKPNTLSIHDNSENSDNNNNNNNNVENSYEHVVKQNYSKDECFALAEIAGLIKGLATCMINEDGLISPYIRSSIHNEIQITIQLHIGELLSVATKKKKSVRVDLTQIRTLGLDFVDGMGIDDSFFKSKKKTDITLQSRCVGPSNTQLDLLQTSIYNLFATRMNGKRPFEKDLSSSTLKLLEDFYSRSFNYPYLLNYKKCILEMIDLGDLWYREFYLELTKTLQFPIELSLPWILTDTILESEELSMMEYILYPLDIYNDAANRALLKLKQQFLYDEIEAEVNLCFDQLIFKLSNSIYKSFKTHASTLIFDNCLQNSLIDNQVFIDLDNIQTLNINKLSSSSQINYLSSNLQYIKTRYNVILSQRHYQLLGNFVDLNNLISQRINNLFRKNIDNAISRFEARDLTSIISLHTQLNVIKLTHKLLSNNFIQLDNYNSMFNEINRSLSLISYHSRIAFHIISECVSDFFPTYNFNTITNRFIKSKITFGEPIQRDNLPSQQLHWLYGDKKLTTAFSAYHENFRNILGLKHIKVILDLLGLNTISLIIDEILTNLNLKLENILIPYISELMNAMPPNSKCPLYDYKISGGIGYFSGKLIDIISYPPLQSEVFQQFKEFGNTIAFLNLIDKVKENSINLRFNLTSNILGITPKTLYSPLLSENTPLYKNSSNLSSYINNNKDILKYSESSSSSNNLHTIVNTIYDTDLLLRKRTNLSLFASSLDRIYEYIGSVRNEWDQQTPEEGAVIPVESSREFYRLFSAFKYIYCLPLERGQGEYDCFDLFGDGLFWAGLTIIHFLGQRKRFETFDFSNHLLNIAQVYPPESNEKISIQFITNAKRIQHLSSYIFQLLSNYIPEYQPFIVQIHPPTDDSDASQFKITSSRLLQSTSELQNSPLRESQKQQITDDIDFPPPPTTLAPPPPQ